MAPPAVSPPKVAAMVSPEGDAPHPADDNWGRAALEEAARQEAEAYLDAMDSMAMEGMAMPGMADHGPVLDLVPARDATHVAILDGDWSDPDIWMDRKPPEAGARVWIMPGRTVTVDAVLPDAFSWVRVSGTLRFAPDRDTRLGVDTVVVDPDGAFVAGTEDAPVRPDAVARVDFVNDGPFDPAVDPDMLGLGLISLGTTTVHGADKTPWLALADTARAGERRLQLAADPAGWRPGDVLALAGTGIAGGVGSQDERLAIAAIDGRTVWLAAPLRFTHSAPTMQQLAAQYGEAPQGDPLRAYIANLTRNVRFASANPATIADRGQAMIMNPEADIEDAGFYDMGRTDKSTPISGANPRARYPLHFHRTGPDAAQAKVSGSVVDGSPGWGIVNHSSNVDVEGSVTYDVLGSGFVSEAGDERGAFRDSISIHNPGAPGANPDYYIARRAIGDFGFNGHGFWIQSPRVALRGNVAAGSASYAYVYYAEDFEKLGNAPQKSAVEGFSDNTAYASRRGLRLYNVNPAGSPSVIAGLTTWGLRYEGFGLDYANNVQLVGSRLIGSGASSDAAAVYVDSGRQVSFVGNYVVGYQQGLTAGYGGQNTIAGNYLKNSRADVVVRKITHLTSPVSGARVVDIAGNRIAGGGVRLDSAGGVPAGDMFWTWFAPERITWDGVRLYYPEQAPDYVVRGTNLADIDGKTNAELARRFGIATAGAVAPAASAARRSLAGGVAGPAADMLPILTPVTTYTYPQRFDLVFWDPMSSRYVTRSIPAGSAPRGWNRVTQTDASGALRTGFIRVK